MILTSDAAIRRGRDGYWLGEFRLDLHWEKMNGTMTKPLTGSWNCSQILSFSRSCASAARVERVAANVVDPLSGTKSWMLAERTEVGTSTAAG